VPVRQHGRHRFQPHDGSRDRFERRCREAGAAPDVEGASDGSFETQVLADPPDDVRMHGGPAERVPRRHPRARVNVVDIHGPHYSGEAARLQYEPEATRRRPSGRPALW